MTHIPIILLARRTSTVTVPAAPTPITVRSLNHEATVAELVAEAQRMPRSRDIVAQGKNPAERKTP